MCITFYGIEYILRRCGPYLWLGVRHRIYLVMHFICTKILYLYDYKNLYFIMHCNYSVEPFLRYVVILRNFAFDKKTLFCRLTYVMDLVSYICQIYLSVDLSILLKYVLRNYVRQKS